MKMNKNDQILAMRNHLPVAEIAKRLGVSKRTVQRALKQVGQDDCHRLRHCPENETIMMKYYRRLGKSYQYIGWQLGLSRQAVEQRLSKG